MASHYEAPIRKPLVTGNKSYHDVSVDIAALRSVVASELSKAFANIQKQSGGCDFNDLIKATRMWAMAQKAKAPDK
mgnify:CR=1 FL=1